MITIFLFYMTTYYLFISITAVIFTYGLIYLSNIVLFNSIH